MPLFDRVKAQAQQVAQKAQEAGKAGQAKIDELQTRRRVDSLYRDLGAAYYGEKTGKGANPAEVDRLVAEITTLEAELNATPAT